MKRHNLSRKEIHQRVNIFVLLVCIPLIAFLTFTGCEKKADNPVNTQTSVKEWTCEECHTNQDELSLLADYLVGGEGEEGG